MAAVGTVFEGEFNDVVDEFWSNGRSYMLLVTGLCSFFTFFLPFFSVFVFGFTMSEEGGLEEFCEFFSRMAMRSLSRVLSSRRFLIIPSSSAIRLSLASMMLRILFFCQLTKDQFLGKMKKMP